MMADPQTRIAISEWMPIDTGLKAGQRVCAIGDVHGRAENLSSLLDLFEGDAGVRAQSTLVFLGDLHDRGVDDLGAIDLAISSSGRAFSKVHFLMGNHEQLLKLTLLGQDPTVRFLWQQNGGGSLMRQLGIHRDLETCNCSEFAERLADALGPGRLAWLEALQSHARVGNLLFVHAGINHRMTLERHLGQHWSLLDDLHWSWIRGEFLRLPVTVPDLTVVHGHTPVRRYPVRDFARSDFVPHQLQGGKINLDSGSFITGCVIGAEFLDESWRLAAAVCPPSS